MIMNKFFRTAALAALTLTALTASAQVVTRSRQVPGFRPYDVDLAVMSKAEKDSVMMVADLWKKYVESFTSSSVSEEQRRSMWMDGASDYLLELDDGSMLYSSFRENRIIDVRKLDHGIYELVSMTTSKLPGEEHYGWVEAVYRVCAMAVAKDSGNGVRNNPFRLGNWLDAFASSLKKQSFGMIDYYRVPGCRIPANDYSGMATYALNLVNDYGISFNSRIRYVVAPTKDQCERISGFLFNAYYNPVMGTVASKSSGYTFYGRTFGSNTLLSNYYDDCHDVALLIVRRGFPDARPMMQEGFASYYGGLMTFSYADLKSALRSMFASGKEIDLSNEDSFYDTCIPVSVKGSQGPVVVPLETVLGAVLVDYSLKKGGVKLVKELLGCRDYLELFDKLGVKAGDIDGFIIRILGNG